MPKFFVVSDVHGFYDEMIDALNEAGFDKNNENHWLISCGDEFDRGRQPEQIMNYLNELERKILIRGNHLSLLEECIANQEYQWHDISNGTYQTIMDLSGFDYIYSPYIFEDACIAIKNRIKKYSNNCLDYFETKNYIFVHSWIPYNIEEYYDEESNISKMLRYHNSYSYNEDWRNASFKEWEQARWINPYEMANRNLNLTKKTIVSGHWHCSTYWARKEDRNEFGEDAKFDIAYDEKHNFIGIDACTAHTGKINVLVIEDDFLED